MLKKHARLGSYKNLAKFQRWCCGCARDHTVARMTAQKYLSERPRCGERTSGAEAAGAHDALPANIAVIRSSSEKCGTERESKR